MIWKRPQASWVGGFLPHRFPFSSHPPPSLYFLLPPLPLTGFPIAPSPWQLEAASFPAPTWPSGGALGVGCQQQPGSPGIPTLALRSEGSQRRPQGPCWASCFPTVALVTVPLQAPLPFPLFLLPFSLLPPPFLHPSLSAQPRSFRNCQLRPPLAAPAQTKGEEARPDRLSSWGPSVLPDHPSPCLNSPGLTQVQRVLLGVRNVGWGKTEGQSLTGGQLIFIFLIFLLLLGFPEATEEGQDPW